MRHILRWGGMLAALMMLPPLSSAQLPSQLLGGKPVLTVARYDYAHVPKNYWSPASGKCLASSVELA